MTSGPLQPAAWLLTLLLASPLPAAPARPVPRVEYNRDIRPILSDNCFLCHGPDQNTRKAKMRLDIRDDALASKAFVPGQPAESELVARIFTADPDDIMPPPDSHKQLTVAQKELLRRWIAEGAEYQPHWAYVPPTRPAVPPILHRKSPILNPIDAFLLQNLEAHKLKPSREADRRTLLRRLSLDLVGLPPTPEEVAAFVADKDPRAFEKQVERLLASPHFGERMAAPWLDLARFSDTVGYHGDQNQRIFPYRDYVIASFNRNKPFDVFTAEQLAGDLLPNPTTEQRIATGFNRLNMVTREGGAQPGEYLAKYAADRVRTVSTTWLGSTMGCAECHDHKFDPFTSRDFYSLAAFFADVKQWGVYNDYKYTPNPDLKGWSNDHPFPPELEVDSDALQRRAARYRRLLREHLASVHARAVTNVAWAAWVKASGEFLAGHPSGWRTLPVVPPKPPEPTFTRTTNVVEGVTNIGTKTNPPPAPTLIAQDNDAVQVLLSGKKGEEKIEFRLPPGPVAALRLERLPDEGKESTADDSTARAVTLSAVLKRKGKESKVSFHRADADHKEPRYANGEEILGILGGWKPSTRQARATQTAVWLPEPPLNAREGDTMIVTLKSTSPLTLRLSGSPFAAADPLQAGAPPSLQAALDRSHRRSQAEASVPGKSQEQSADQSGDDDRVLLAERFLLSTQSDTNAFARFQRLQRELLECREGRAHTLVTVAWKPAITRVLPRGNWQNESGQIVSPAPPHFLPQPRPAEGDRLTRLDLARWLTSRDNPLTARVFVNRLWKQFFGSGLSAVIDDVGAQGEWPVHPALLDWLAVEFMESGWDVKHLVRRIVTSAAYRQESNLRPELRDRDPQNRWLASQNPRRLEAEFVRDNALFVAGLLHLEVGGPSARPYQPGGYYEALQFPDRDYAAQTDERQYRRGLYMHWQRTFLHPMLANFDAPAREECTATRNVSNTPQQALTLLNDPTFVEAARVFAAKLLAEPGLPDKARLALAFQRALGRAPRSKETASLTRFLAGQRAHYAASQDEATKLLKVGLAPAPSGLDPVGLAAWTQVCRVILNTQESVTRY